MELRSFSPCAGPRTSRLPANRQPPTANHLFWLLLLLTVGCQPAVRYEKPTVVAPPAETAKSDDGDPVGWLNPRPRDLSPDTPIVFVAEKDGAAWAKLPKFWNPPPTAEEKAAAALALFPGTAAPLAALEDAVRIKVPAGLDDPRPFLPSDPDSNPPTLNKWRLGRRLFYDPTWLTDEGSRSCASCHQPRSGFADDARDHGDFNTPTLVNCVFNRRQFWDGRVGSLEEVVQRTVADETASEEKLPFHTWGGVVRRLRASAEYQRRFPEVFGNEPTQDAVGKALATYLRTLLAADSVYDRAVAAQKAENAAELKAEHCEKALDDASLKRLGFDPAARGEAAKKIYRGYRLFHDLEERKTGCAACHGGGEFTDGEFHNLGVGFTAPEPGKEPGRFASLPLGRKDALDDRRLQDADAARPAAHGAVLPRRLGGDAGRRRAVPSRRRPTEPVPRSRAGSAGPAGAGSGGALAVPARLEGAEVEPAVGPGSE